jgi:hypothetical protein
VHSSFVLRQVVERTALPLNEHEGCMIAPESSHIRLAAQCALGRFAAVGTVGSDLRVAQA